MRVRTLRKLYVALVVFEWLAFGVAGVLFVYDCGVLNVAGAIGNLLGALGLFIFNLVTWPGDKRALDSLKATAEEEDDSDAEGLES